jgi:tripartite ATP-independent transporter DctP family solute receptor
MKRNKSIIVFALVMLVFLLTVSTLDAKSKPIVLTLGYLGAVGSVEDIAVNEIARVAREESDGRLEIQLFPAGQLGSFESQLSSITMGSQDIAWGELAFLSNIVRDYQIMSMGYAFRDQEHLNKFMDAPVGQRLKEELLQKGILLLTAHGNQLPRTLVTKKPVKTPDDLEGIKMRVPGWPISLKLWEALGTKPTMVNWGEVYLALSQNVVDGMECGFEWIYPTKFYEVAKYITLTNHVRGLRGMVVNPQKYNSLPDDLKAVLLKAAIAGEEMYNEKVQLAAKEHAEEMTKMGAIIQEVDESLFRDRVIGIIEECENEGLWSKGLFDEVQKIK